MKEIKNTIIINQPSQSIKLAETLVCSPINTNPSAVNYPVLNWIITYELIQVGLLTSVYVSSLKLDGIVKGWWMIIVFWIPLIILSVCSMN